MSLSLLFLTALLVAHAILIELRTLKLQRFAALRGGPLIAAVVFGVAFAIGLYALWFMPGKGRVKRGILCLPALLVCLRFYMPSIVAVVISPPLAATVSPEMVAYLREVSAAQEQYRLRFHVYAPSADSLTRLKKGFAPAIVRHGDSAWSARITHGGVICSLWSRRSPEGTGALVPEGAPVCGALGQHSETNTVGHTFASSCSAQREVPASGVEGRWTQHRANMQRDGRAETARAGGPFRWTARICGELRASAAVAGNQVFVGAHGNGEFVSLSLDSGLANFRVRLPNWMHHEPVMTETAVLVAFGNNETTQWSSTLGSHPTGIVAYDRRSGLELWRDYARGCVMVSPVLADSLVAIVSCAGEAIAWRASDGQRRWQASLPGGTAMGNPMLVDSLLVIGLEPAMVCALSISTGARRYCKAISDVGMYTGHASVASDDNLILATFVVEVPHAERRWESILTKVTAIPFRWTTPYNRHIVVALRATTGEEVWRRPLGAGNQPIVGHVAGTPAIVDGVVYLTSPLDGVVYAIRASTGDVIWAAAVRSTRGSVFVADGAVFASTTNKGFVVLDQATGKVRCTQRLPGASDRAGLTIAGQTAILTLRNGLVLARPLADWLSCHA